MPIEIPKGLPFSVDTWTPCSKMKRHHFLTHAHKDHAQGIVAHASYPIYSTLLTKTLILQIYPQLDESIFVCIEIGQSLVTEDPDGDFVVTAFDANHCPGAVMFLFEGNFGNILHTGDCRLTQECLQSLPDKYIGKKGKEPLCTLDYVFLDCTFGQFSLKMPSKQTAIRQVINLIWRHPDARTVYLTCDLLGQEEILVEVSRTFGEKIYVDKDSNLECFRSLERTVPEIISQDSSSRFQLFDGFPKLYERAEAKIAEARSNFQQEPLIIRPSTQWYACNVGVSEVEKQKKERFDQPVRDLYGVWHVCYSIHSSKEELEWALQLLAPKWVVSTTPSCRALELNYVKNHCLKNQKAFNDSLWKLLDISAVASLAPDEVGNFLSYSDVVDISNSCTETRPEPVVIPSHQKKRLSLSPPSKRPMFTLFGRARNGVPNLTFQNEHKKIPTSCDSMEKATIETENVAFQKENVTEVKFEEPLATKRKRKTDFSETNDTETHKSAIISHTSSCNSYVGTEIVSLQRGVADVKFEKPSGTKKLTDFVETNFTETCQPAASSPTSMTNNYGENLRKLYRSRNVPLPQCLPSLVKLMSSKRSSKKTTYI